MDILKETPKPMASPLTAEGAVAPVDGDALLSAVSGVGSEDVAVTGPLRRAAANLRQTETEEGLPLHHVVTGLQRSDGRDACVNKREGDRDQLTPQIDLTCELHLKDGTVYDGAHCVRVVPPLGVRGAGVRWSPSR